MEKVMTAAEFFEKALVETTGASNKLMISVVLSISWCEQYAAYREKITSRNAWHDGYDTACEYRDYMRQPWPNYKKTGFFDWWNEQKGNNGGQNG